MWFADKAVICDVDGVLADTEEALRAMEPGDWDGFHGQCGTFQPLHNGVSALLGLLFDAGIRIVILSCRPALYKGATAEWLLHHGIGFHECHLRPEGIHYNEWKRIAVRGLQARYDIVLGIDDNPAEMEMYRQLGIPALYVHSGSFDADMPQHNWSEENRYAR